MLAKPKKYKNPIPALRRKADKLYQKLHVKNNKYCLICSSKTDCIHHFFTKASSSSLRYEEDNGIPICQRCHCKLHRRQDPSMIAIILRKKGKGWYERLDQKRLTPIKTNVNYYRSIIEHLEGEILNEEIQ
ncbi:MAG TPA: hypothetical protein VMY59_04855 [Candidatus Thermoplasmatota archaeon]|nr:hypothetical protein [Candidatus Thermoplasmatota archaeon]